MCPHSVLEAEVPLQASGEGPPALSQLPAAVGSPRVSLACQHVHLVSASVVTRPLSSASVFLCLYFLSLEAPILPGLRPTLVQ